MKVILIERVPSLGNIGEIVNVSAGHARNFLFPKKLAVLADESHKAQLENNQKKVAKKIAAETSAAKAIKAKIDGVTLEFIRRVGSNGKLFGTITNTELAKELLNRGVDVERRLIVIETPIKSVGTFGVKVKIFTGVEAAFSVKVAIDPAQIEEMKKQQAAGGKKKKKAAEAAENAEAAAVEGEEASAPIEVAPVEEKPAKKEKGEKKEKAPKKESKKASKA